MVYNVFSKFLFIHIPRCSGTSMTNILQSICPKSIVEELGWKHESAKFIKRSLLKNQWDDYYKFAIIRSPWDIIESFWRHKKILCDQSVDDNISIADSWLQELSQIKKYTSFDEYVEKEYVYYNKNIRDAGGFWGYWCCDKDYNELGVNPILFDDIVSQWPNTCSRLDIPYKPYPHTNHAKYPKPLWHKRLINQVGDLCWRDLQKFKFQPVKL